MANVMAKKKKKIVILLDNDEEIKTTTGIILFETPDPSVIVPKKATVIDVCEYKLENGVKIEPELKVGDRVYVNGALGSNGLKTMINGTVYNIISEANILGKVV